MGGVTEEEEEEETKPAGEPNSSPPQTTQYDIIDEDPLNLINEATAKDRIEELEREHSWLQKTG